jgi:hypothetical protein
MTTYMTRQIRVQLTEDQSGQKVILRRGDAETKFNDEAALNEGGLVKHVIPIPTTDQDLMEGQNIAVGKVMYIETDTELVVKLDDVADTGITVKPLVDDENTIKPGILYLEGDFTHAYVSVAGASGDANVIFGVIGA